jgi:hypothetical protein
MPLGSSAVMMAGNYVAPPDPYTMWLLHCDGSNGAQVFTDSSLAGHTATVNGHTNTSTAQYKFSPSSMLCDGSGDGLTYANSADFNVAAGDFTVDMWLRGVASTNYEWILITDRSSSHISSTYGIEFGIGPDSVLYCWLSASGDNGPVHAAGNMRDGNWHHAALVRSGSTLMIYADGTRGDTVSVGTASVTFTSDFKLGVGCGYNAAYSFNGYIDEVRFSKGIARWTGATYTVPTAPY